MINQWKLKSKVFMKLIFAILLLTESSLAQEDWLHEEANLSVNKIISQWGPLDGHPGAIIASPSRANPDYYYHWVRDAALVAQMGVQLYAMEKRTDIRALWKYKMQAYIDFSKSNQNSNALTGLGEPKFYVTGKPYDEPWGRPQNDGPALRAIAMIQWAAQLISEGETEYVKNELYSVNFPATSLIKKDLEYVSNHWKDSSFDLWEEVRADHFYTRMVQRKALVYGAWLAEKLGDPGAADWYRQQAHQINYSLESFWSAERKTILTSINYVEGVSYKESGLDFAVILGVLHGSMEGFSFSINDSRVWLSLDRIIKSFQNLYPINQRANIPGFALGRYPEDNYTGLVHDYNPVRDLSKPVFAKGNPWVLCTLGGAEIFYRGADLVRIKNPALSQQMREIADAYVARVKYHANSNGTLSEQIDRNSGYMVSARDLTWNYVAVLSTYFAKQ